MNGLSANPNLSQLLLLLCGDIELNPGPEKIRPLTLNDLENVENELKDLASKWFEIGSILKFSKKVLEKMKKEDTTEQEKLHFLVKEWLEWMCPCPTWGTVVNMLKHDRVNEEELADKLEKKYPGNLAESESTNDPLAPIGCSIENCRCEQLVSSILDKSTISVQFPYLVPDESETDGGQSRRRKLQIDYEELIVEFNVFITYVWRALNRKNVTVAELANYLRTVDTFQITPTFTCPLTSICTPFLPQFKAAESINEILPNIFDYFSAFNYHVMIDMLLNLGGSARDRRQVDRYRDKINAYTSRKVAECPQPFCLPVKSNFCLIDLTLEKNFQSIRLQDVESFRSRLAYTLHLSKYVLKLVSVVPSEITGLVTYTFQIPSFARNMAFPLNHTQLDDLKIEKVHTVNCCCFKLVIPEPDPNDERDIRNVLAPARPDEIEEEANKMEVETDNYETPPSSPTLKPKSPLYASLPPDSLFRIDVDKVYIPSKLERLQERCPHGTNYVALIPHASSKSIYAAMVLCQHAAERKKEDKFVKCIILANTKPRAVEILEEMKRILPNLDVALFTGTEENSMTTKLCLSQDSVIICTTGKLCSELEAEVVKFSSISLLLIDDCHLAMFQTPLEAAVHKYLQDKVYRTLKPPSPFMVGITSDPGERSTALDEETMQTHLLKVAGGVDSTAGIVFTEDVTSDTYIQLPSSKPRPKPEIITRKFNYRDPKKDFVMRIEVEMTKWEQTISFVCADPKWSFEYGEFVQSQLQVNLSLLGTLDQTTSAAVVTNRLRVLELLLCYAKALRTFLEFGFESALDILQGGGKSSILAGGDEAVLTPSQYNSLKNMREELETLMTMKNPILEAVNDIVCKQFNNSRVKSRGVLFVDSFRDAQFLCEEISKSHFLSRPFAIPRFLVANYSTDTCSEVEKEEVTPEEFLEKGREGLDAFARGESRLLLIPYALESDTVKVEGIRSEFDFIARLHLTSKPPDTMEMEYVLALVRSKETKSFADLRRDFDMCRVEAGLKSLPTGEDLKKKLTRALEDVMYNFQARYIVPLSKRRKKKPKDPTIEMIQLRCKKCKVFACHGMEVYSLFVDGGRHCVVPHRDFSTRFTTKPYRSKHKTIKRVNRQKRMFCSNCSAPWGIICHFPAKGCELPVIKSKHFIFEMNHKYYTIKMWSDALFTVPPVTAYPKFHMHGNSMDVDSE